MFSSFYFGSCWLLPLCSVASNYGNMNREHDSLCLFRIWIFCSPVFFTTFWLFFKRRTNSRSWLQIGFFSFAQEWNESPVDIRKIALKSSPIQIEMSMKKEEEDKIHTPNGYGLPINKHQFDFALSRSIMIITVANVKYIINWCTNIEWFVITKSMFILTKCTYAHSKMTNLMLLFGFNFIADAWDINSIHRNESIPLYAKTYFADAMNHLNDSEVFLIVVQQKQSNWHRDWSSNFVQPSSNSSRMIQFEPYNNMAPYM